MNSDCAYRIGKTHAVCQDYAVAQGGVRPYVLLADGCSSSPETDIGARLLVKSAESFLRRRPGMHPTDAIDTALERYHAETLSSAHDLAGRMGLTATCLDATLLTAVVQESSWLIAVYGDGVIAMQDREGYIHVRSLTYAAGYPYYLNYAADTGRRDAFLKRRDNRRKVDFLVLSPDGTWKEGRSCLEAADASCYRESGDLGAAEWTWIAVLSDGVHSVIQGVDTATSRTTVSVPLPVVLRTLLDFKGGSGVFVQRRLQRFAQQCQERGWQHRDDLSVGVLYLGA
jgi:hypothetical protein